MVFQKTIPFKKRTFKTIFVLIFLFLLSFSGLKIWILSEANLFAKSAVEVFNQDKTKSLIALIDSDRFSLKEKNEAIWALGILKDKDVLPKLESLYTGQVCNHKTELCQYEIEKAIAKINRNWRGNLFAAK